MTSAEQPEIPSRRIVVGTAGHVDHGKTSLVQALTGIDCDRFAEEKERGITIDIGFAHLQEGDLQIGFVDVPGHERFVHNALAGLGGIDRMMLVVAADEGVMPQTREHLAICSLLRIPAGLVALTKIDLVDDDLLDLAELELAEELATSPFAGVPIVRVSSRTGEGIDTLRRALVESATDTARPERSARSERSARPERSARSARPARLPIDRAFHLRGLGVLVTGTLAAGRIAVGDELRIVPRGGTVRVRSIQVHDTERQEALAGERTALQLSGTSRDQILRGDQLTAPGAYGVSRHLCASFRLLPDAPAALEGPVEMRFHLYSGDVLARLRPLRPARLLPGEEGLVEIRLRHPMPVTRGDRFILRRPSPKATVGGGQILDPRWRSRRGAEIDRALDGVAGDTTEALRSWVAAAGLAGLRAQDIAPRLGEPVETVSDILKSLADEAILVAVGTGPDTGYIVPAAFAALESDAAELLRQYFKTHRLARGMPRAEALSGLLPRTAASLGAIYLEWLEKRGILVDQGSLIDLPGRGNSLTPDESQLAGEIAKAFEAGGLTPPSPQEVCRKLAAKPQIFEGVLRYLTERGRLVRLPDGLFLSRQAIDALVLKLRATGWQTFSVPEFKEHFGLSRKWAIPLLEHLDSARVTARQGEGRVLLAEASVLLAEANVLLAEANVLLAEAPIDPKASVVDPDQEDQQ